MGDLVVLITGSRSWRDSDAVIAALTKHAPAMVVTGGAEGADQIAALQARRLGIHVAEVVALWDRHKRAAGPIRNRAMLALQPDLVLAFWDGSSPGTRSMIDSAAKAGVAVEVVRSSDPAPAKAERRWTSTEWPS